MKIALDPGHGMSNRQPGVYDPGGEHVEAGFGFHEAEIALRYALVLREALRSRGSTAFLTREDARDHAPLAARAGNAKLVGAEILVSLHVNTVEDARASGIEVLYRGEASRRLAQALQSAVVAAAKLRNRGIKQRDDLAVLRFPGPAALVELGFLGNDGDRAVIIDPARRHLICEAIADALAAQAPASPADRRNAVRIGRAARGAKQRDPASHGRKRRRRAQRGEAERSP